MERKKQSNRILALLLSIAMIVTMLPTTVFGTSVATDTGTSVTDGTTLPVSVTSAGKEIPLELTTITEWSDTGSFFNNPVYYMKIPSGCTDLTFKYPNAKPETGALCDWWIGNPTTFDVKKQVTVLKTDRSDYSANDEYFLDPIKLSSGTINDYVDTTKDFYFFVFSNDPGSCIPDYAIIAQEEQDPISVSAAGKEIPLELTTITEWSDTGSFFNNPVYYMQIPSGCTDLTFKYPNAKPETGALCDWWVSSQATFDTEKQVTVLKIDRSDYSANDEYFLDPIKLSSGTINDYVDTTKDFYFFVFSNDPDNCIPDYAILAQEEPFKIKAPTVTGGTLVTSVLSNKGDGIFDVIKLEPGQKTLKITEQDMVFDNTKAPGTVLKDGYNTKEMSKYSYSDGNKSLSINVDELYLTDLDSVTNQLFGWISSSDKKALKEYISENFALVVNPVFTGSNMYHRMILLPNGVDLREDDFTEEDKAPLKNLLDTVSDNNEKYYKENDFYNGKEESTKGFWKDFTSANGPRQRAQSVLDNPMSKKQILDATDALQKQIHKLVPKTELNTGILYRELKVCEDKNLVPEGYTVKSWMAFDKARKDARTYFDSLYNNGEATAENVSGNQTKLDKAYNALKDSKEGLDSRIGGVIVTEGKEALAGIGLYTELYNPEKLVKSNYTENSWNAFVKARNEALEFLKKHKKVDDTMGQKELTLIIDTFGNFVNSCLALEENKDKIDVEVAFVDNITTRGGRNKPFIPTDYKTLTLNKGATLLDLMKEMGAEKFWLADSNNNNGFIQAKSGFYLNGVYRDVYYGGRLSFLNKDTQSDFYKNFYLHDGDQIVYTQFKTKMVKNISEVDEPLELSGALNLVKHQKITASLEDNKVKAGVPFTVNVSRAAATAMYYDGVYSPAEGITIYSGSANEDKALAAKEVVKNDTGFKTDANGNAEVTLYHEGWCLLNAFNLKDDNDSYSNGAPLFVYVEANNNLQGIKDTLLEELKSAHDKHDKDFYKEKDWAAIEEAYNAGVEAVGKCETAGTARDAQTQYLRAILEKADEAERYNAGNLKEFRRLLGILTENFSSLDKKYQNQVNQLISTRGYMTVYQVGQLTPVENENYDKIVKLNEAGLPDAKSYNLKVEYDFSGVPEADRAGLQAMITWLQENTTKDGTNGDLGGTQMAGLYTFNKVTNGKYSGMKNYEPITKSEAMDNVEFCASPKYASWTHIRGDRTTDINRKPYGDNNFTYELAQGNWRIVDTEAQNGPKIVDGLYDSEGGREYYVNGNKYEMRGIKIVGVPEGKATSKFNDIFDFSDYNGKTTGYVTVKMKNSFTSFRMPSNDVTFVVEWAPAGGTADEITNARESAKAAITAEFEGYKKADYADDKWVELTAIHTGAAARVDAAKTVDEISNVRKAVIAEMAAIAKKDAVVPQPGSEIPDFGKVVGKVHVNVENNTFPGGAWTGTILSGWYDLCERDTMMTVFLKAIDEAGFTWKGQGGKNEDSDKDYTISYIASISKDGKSLGEFSGESGSGWMATLNDWFTNFGISEFGYANGELGNNDLINITFTQNLGVDVGGTWGNSDTSIKALNVTGGKLSPTFNGKTHEYILNIEGDRANIKITPTAANKNYLVKAFLNFYNVDSAFYKRTETISVKGGDTIYLGCGEHEWPSMNKQGAEARDYTGTKYTIKVVSGSDYSTVIDMISEIGEITYTNYKQNADKVTLAKESYDALDAKAKKKVTNYDKLQEAVEAVESFARADAAKELLTKLPRSKNLSDNEVTALQRQIEEASAAYNKLNEKEKGYITFADVQNYNELVKRLAALTPTEADPIEKPEEPEVPVEPVDPSKPQIEPEGTWKQDAEGNWEYETGEEEKLANEFAVIDDKLYSFDEEGKMETGWKKLEGTNDYIYLHLKGGNAMKGWQLIDGFWYDFDNTDYQMKKEWQEIDGMKYYFHKAGNMMTGWQKIDGKWYYFHLKGGNAMKGWQRIDGKSYYFYADGHMAANTTTPDGYKVDANGAWVK